MRTGWRDAEADGSGPLAATSIGRGRKYFSAAICRLPDGTHLPARGTGISDADASAFMIWKARIMGRPFRPTVARAMSLLDLRKSRACFITVD